MVLIQLIGSFSIHTKIGPTINTTNSHHYLISGLTYIGGGNGQGLACNPYADTCYYIDGAAGLASISVDLSESNDITMTYDNVSKTVKIYLNGILGNNYTYPGATNIYKVNFSAIGARTDTHWAYNGTIDNIMIYNRSLSSDEILSLDLEGIRGVDKNDIENNSLKLPGNDYVKVNNLEVPIDTSYTISYWLKQQRPVTDVTSDYVWATNNNALYTKNIKVVEQQKHKQDILHILIMVLHMD